MQYIESPLFHGANYILTLLEEAGHVAYIVGGAVRDIYRGEIPHDYDLVTSATPDKVIHIMNAQGLTTTNVTGIHFGVVVVKYESFTYEIATFRRESYDIGRRPTEVLYSDTWEEDVERRDFTMNGMTMDRKGQIIDLVGGKSDIDRRIIRSIGCSEVRFHEDPLRMFRLCRFAGQLGYAIDEETYGGIGKNLSKVQELPLERVRQELEKLLLSPYAHLGLDAFIRSGLGNGQCQRRTKDGMEYIPILRELYPFIDVPQESPFHGGHGWHPTWEVVKGTKPDLALRWAALLHTVGEGVAPVRHISDGQIRDFAYHSVSATMAKTILERFGYGTDFVALVVWLVAQYRVLASFQDVSRDSLKEWIRRQGLSKQFRTTEQLVEAVTALVDLCVSHRKSTGEGITDIERLGQELIALGEQFPIHTRDLHYDPDLPHEIQPFTGQIMKALLQCVQQGELENCPQSLRIVAKKEYMHLLERKE